MRKHALVLFGCTASLLLARHTKWCQEVMRKHALVLFGTQCIYSNEMRMHAGSHAASLLLERHINWCREAMRKHALVLFGT
jgi:hypothetical protein